MNLLFDIETDGLYDNLTTIHCVAIKDLGNNQTLVFNDEGTQEPIARAITMLEGAKTIIGQNVINYVILSFKSSIHGSRHHELLTLLFLVVFITLTFLRSTGRGTGIICHFSYMVGTLLKLMATG